MATKPTRTDWREIRRFRALELKHESWTHEEIADALAVSKAAVSQWMKAAREQSEPGLCSRPRLGAAPKLPRADLALLPELLAAGAEAYGFRGAIWNYARIACVNEWEFGVSYHPAHVSRLLKALEWTPQQPATRATQQNEGEVARFRAEVWPALKKKHSASAGLLSVLTRRPFTSCPA